MMKTRQDFLSALQKQFPEAYARLDEIDEGLLHLEVAAFRRTVEEACQSGRGWYVEKAMRFVEDALGTAGPELENALNVSFVEDFALGDFSTEARTLVKERTSPRLLREFRTIHDAWK